MSFIFDESTAARGDGKKQWLEVCSRRIGVDAVEKRFEAEMRTNAVARIPTDVYRDIDNQTKQIMLGDQGNVILQDLLPLSRSVHIGKMVAEYRRVSTIDGGETSLSGQVSKKMDHVEYDFDGILVPIFDKAVGREWRELEAMRSEGFDALIDDQAESVRICRNRMIDNFVDGTAGLKFKGYQSYGIKNNPKTLAVDLGAGGLNIDFTSAAATFAQIEAGWLSMRDRLRGRNNNALGDITWYISPEIEKNLLRRGTTDAAFETFLAALKKIPNTKDIKVSDKLTGNQVIGMILSSEFVQPVIGMAMTSTPIQRNTPFDDFNLLTWSAGGLLIKADYAGRSGVLYASS